MCVLKMGDNSEKNQLFNYNNGINAYSWNK